MVVDFSSYARYARRERDPPARYALEYSFLLEGRTGTTTRVAKIKYETSFFQCKDMNNYYLKMVGCVNDTSILKSLKTLKSFEDFEDLGDFEDTGPAGQPRP
jgi:hypothetical protein